MHPVMETDVKAGLVLWCYVVTAVSGEASVPSVAASGQEGGSRMRDMEE